MQKLSLGLALARRWGHLEISVRVGVGRLTWRLRQFSRAVRSSRASGPRRDKAKAQSGGAQEVAAPRTQGVRDRSRAPTLPAGPSSASSPAMTHREQCSGAAHWGTGPNTDKWAEPGPEALPARPRPPHTDPAPGAELSAGWAGLHSGALAFGLYLSAPPFAEASYL